MVKKKTFEEKRHPIPCPNCGMQMVCMNNYFTSKDGKKTYVWYICSRRKASGETGCGHKTPVEVKKKLTFKKAEIVFDNRLVGKVRSNEGVTMFIQDNFETFNSWLHQNKEKFAGKKVELILRIIEQEG